MSFESHDETNRVFRVDIASGVNHVRVKLRGGGCAVRILLSRV